jgi:hypothetical protein
MPRREFVSVAKQFLNVKRNFRRHLVELNLSLKVSSGFF